MSARDRFAALQFPGVRVGAPPVEPGRRLPTGIDCLDELLGGGLPRGHVSEIVGGPSSGRTALLHALLASATRRGEATAVVDLPDALDPRSLANAGVDLNVADTDQRPGERVALDGTQSSDTDGTIVSYVWSNGSGAQIGTGANLQVRLPDGASTIVLTVTDDDGVSATDTLAVAVAESPRPTTLADLPNLTRNQRAIAGALDRICARLESQDEDASLSEDQENLRARCEGLRYRNTQANQVEALTELNGEDFALARTQTLLFANTQYASVMDRLMALRGGARLP